MICIDNEASAAHIRKASPSHDANDTVANGKGQTREESPESHDLCQQCGKSILPTDTAKTHTWRGARERVCVYLRGLNFGMRSLRCRRL